MKKYLPQIIFIGLLAVVSIFILTRPSLATPIPNPLWSIRSIDVMKYTKDNICSQSSTTTINSMLQSIVDGGGNYVSISGYYDDPVCAGDQSYMAKWVILARAKNLKVWWRMKDLSWEGDYSVTKATSTLGSIHINAMDNWLNANSSNTPLTMKSGDIFTPFAEIQNGGINGINYCGSSGICQFANNSDFNTFTRTIQSDAVSKVPTGVLVGYYGFDGFIVAGLNNPDHQGSSYLESATINLMGEVTIDDYPTSYGTSTTGTADNFQAHLALFHSVIQSVSGSSTIPIILGEYGTINSTSTADSVYQINLELTDAVADSKTIGFNYWNLGPSGTEGLLNGDLSHNALYDAFTPYYLAQATSTLPSFQSAIMGINNSKVIIKNGKLIIKN